MPFTTDDVRARFGIKYPDFKFPTPPPPRVGTPYQWDPNKYLMQQTEHRPHLWYLESLLAYTGYATAASQLEEYKSVLGASSCGLVKYVSPLTPNFAWFKWPQATLIAFAGTTNWLQFVHSMIGMIQTAPRPPLGGKIGSFWKAAADEVLHDVQVVLGGTAPDSGFVLSGHSLGGVVAEVTARNLFEGNKWVARRVVTFGAPRVGNLAWSQVSNPPLFRLVGEGDPVTLVPVEGGFVANVTLGGGAAYLGVSDFYHSLGSRTQVYRNGRISSVGTDRSGADGVASAAWDKLIGDFVPYPHALKEYTTRLEYDLFSEQNPRGGFFSDLWLAWVHLRQAVNDYP